MKARSGVVGQQLAHVRGDFAAGGGLRRLGVADRRVDLGEERLDHFGIELRAGARPQFLGGRPRGSQERCGTRDRRSSPRRRRRRRRRARRAGFLAGPADPGSRDRPSARGLSAHEPRDWPQRWRGVEDALAEDRVLAHELPLVRVQRARLVEDRVGDRRPCRRRGAPRRARPRRALAGAVRSGGRPARRAPPRGSSARRGSGCLACMVRTSTSRRLVARAARSRPCLRAYMRSSASLQRVIRCLSASCGQQHDAARRSDRRTRRRSR